MKAAVSFLVKTVIGVVVFVAAAGFFQSVGLGLIATVLVGVVAYIVRRTNYKSLEATARYKAEAAAIMGREPDQTWFTPQRRLMVWLAEKRFYAGPVGGEFDRRYLYSSDGVVESRIDREVEETRSRWWYSYSVNVQLRDIDNPLLKLPCGKDEAMAYKFKALFDEICR